MDNDDLLSIGCVSDISDVEGHATFSRAQDLLSDYSDGDSLLVYIEEASSTESSDERLKKSSVTFYDFGLRCELIEGVKHHHFVRPTQVQVECLPLALALHDVLCQSKCGSGKTAVYVLATLNRIQFSRNPEVLVVVPTRELAVQITEEFERLGIFIENCRPFCFFGGEPLHAHRKILMQKRPNIIVGTPGRLQHLLETKDLNLRHVDHFILDECDLLLQAGENGMRRHVCELLRACPRGVQVMMFSSTITQEKKRREDYFLRFMQNPKIVIVQSDELEQCLRAILQYEMRVKNGKAKLTALLRILDGVHFNQVLIFVNTVIQCHDLCLALEKDYNYSCIAMHSRMDQRERLENFQKFRSYRRRILVTTDVMGRGVDLEYVSCIINYDVPHTEVIYVHRLSRTRGRLEKRGFCVSFSETPQDSKVLRKVEKTHGIRMTDIHKNQALTLDSEF